MENFITIESKNNIINLGYTRKSSISQLALLKTKIIILLSSNDLIIYDPDTPENTKNRHFIQEIQLIQVFQEKLFILQNKLITQIDPNNLDDLQKYDLKEKPYLIQFKDTTKNFICFYVNQIHEILYMNSYFITEIKRLYKETDTIQKILYQNNILLWCTKNALKVFNLETKIMLLKTDLTNYFINNKEEKIVIECYLYNNLLSVIYQQKYIFIYYLDLDNYQIKTRNRTSFEIYNTSISPVNANEYFIGIWINLSMTKICIITLKNDIINLNISKLDLNKYNKSFFYNSKIINCYFNKEYKYICNPEHDIRFITGKQNMYLYDSKEIFLISNSQNQENVFFQNFLANDEINFNDIKDNYKNLNLNKKYFLIVKLIEKDSKNNFNLFLNDKLFSEQYKYLYEELFNLKNIENIKNKSKIMVLYNNYILYLLKISINVFIKLYPLIKNNFDKLLFDKTKEKVIIILIKKEQYDILKKFISKDNNKIIYSPYLENFIQNYKSLKGRNDQENKEQIIYIEALLNQKASLSKNAIKLFIDIKKSDEIYDILLTKNKVNLIFDYDILFDMFEESNLVTLLDILYSPLDIEICLKFYNKLFSICNEIKITKFAYYLILYEKYRLLINSEIIQKLFSISIRNNNTMIFENIYEKYKYKSDNKLFLTKFIRDAFNMFNIDNKKIIDENINELMKKQNIDIYILLLTNINNYKKIIDIYIDHLEKPEECIKYIENSNLNQNIKQDIYNYLGIKINNSKSLSEAKKFYYITQFQDDITIQKPDILKTLNNINYDKNNNDDYDYILLILKELRLKLNTLQTAEEMSHKSSEEVFGELKSNLKRGKIMNNNIGKIGEIRGLKSVIKKNKMKCDFDECDNQEFLYGDKLIIFKECNHFFHKECFQNIKDIYNNENYKYYIDNNFCPKCYDII